MLKYFYDYGWYQFVGPSLSALLSYLRISSQIPLHAKLLSLSRLLTFWFRYHVIMHCHFHWHKQGSIRSVNVRMAYVICRSGWLKTSSVTGCVRIGPLMPRRQNCYTSASDKDTMSTCTLFCVDVFLAHVYLQWTLW